MKVVGRRILLLGFMLVFCSAFMGGGFFISDAHAQAATADAGNKVPDVGGAGSSGGAKIDIGGQCGGESNPFYKIACKATTTLADLRVLVYIISGFGLIAFTFSAIFGKISWKHLSQLAFGLFLVSMMAPFIEYFTGSGSYRLKYGNFLPSTYTSSLSSTDSLSKQDCGKNCTEETLADNMDDPLAAEKLKEAAKTDNGGGTTGTGTDNATGSGVGNEAVIGDGSGDATTPAAEAKKKPSYKDIKGAAETALNGAKGALDILNATKMTARDVGFQRDRIKDAIKNSGGGLKNLGYAVGAISDAGGTIGNSVYRYNKNLERNKEQIENGVEAAKTLGGK